MTWLLVPWVVIWLLVLVSWVLVSNFGFGLDLETRSLSPWSLSLVLTHLFLVIDPLLWIDIGCNQWFLALPSTLVLSLLLCFNSFFSGLLILILSIFVLDYSYLKWILLLHSSFLQWLFILVSISLCSFFILCIHSWFFSSPMDSSFFAYSVDSAFLHISIYSFFIPSVDSFLMSLYSFIIYFAINQVLGSVLNLGLFASDYYYSSSFFITSTKLLLSSFKAVYNLHNFIRPFILYPVSLYVPLYPTKYNHLL